MSRDVFSLFHCIYWTERILETVLCSERLNYSSCLGLGLGWLVLLRHGIQRVVMHFWQGVHYMWDNNTAISDLAARHVCTVELGSGCDLHVLSI